MNQQDNNDLEISEFSEEKGAQTTGEKQRSSTGLDPNIGGLLCYLVHFITGIVFIIVEKENRFIRFHAFQSLFVFGSAFILYFILGMIPFIGWLLIVPLSLLALFLWVFLMIKAYQGQYYKLPFFGDLADKQAQS